MKKLNVYDYAKMIVADGKVEDEEIKTFEKFCLKFDFEEENVKEIIEMLLEAARDNVPTIEIINFVNKTC